MPLPGRPFDPAERCVCDELRVTHDPEFFFGWASNPCRCVAEVGGEAVSNVSHDQEHERAKGGTP